MGVKPHSVFPGRLRSSSYIIVESKLKWYRGRINTDKTSTCLVFCDFSVDIIYLHSNL